MPTFNTTIFPPNYYKVHIPLGYYIYAYLRKSDLTPYYIGKGKGKRAWIKHKSFAKTPKSIDLIVIMEQNLTERGAFALERRYIKWYGRKDIGTGILRNLTDGGEGTSGTIIKVKKVGALNGMYGKTHTDEVKARLGMLSSRRNKKCHWYNDGIKTKYTEQHPGDSWVLGRINQKPTTNGWQWYNNGKIQKTCKEKPAGDEWVSGMLVEKITKICPTCNKTFIVTPCHKYYKYCCSDCIPIKSFYKSCRVCGSAFKVYHSTAHCNHYCSSTCTSKYKELKRNTE